MDADDIMLPKRLEIQYDFMKSNPEIDVSDSWAERLGRGLVVIKHGLDHKTIVGSLLLYNSMIHLAVIMCKSTVERFGIQYLDYKCAEDYKFWTDLALAGARFVNIPMVYCFIEFLWGSLLVFINLRCPSIVKIYY